METKDPEGTFVIKRRKDLPKNTPETIAWANSHFVCWLEDCRELKEAERLIVEAEWRRVGRILTCDEVVTLLGPVDPPLRSPAIIDPDL